MNYFVIKLKHPFFKWMYNKDAAKINQIYRQSKCIDFIYF